jgi:23S rRNA pseudouridine2457 synthase
VNRYFAIFKPMNMLSQFTREQGSTKQVLADLYDFPPDVYPVGRLDGDSEGLLLLSNDKSLTDQLLNPRNKHSRTYLIQLEGEITSEALMRLSKGVSIRIKKQDYITAPAVARITEEPGWLPERHPPVRYRSSISTTWITLTLTEGKNRQVRRMTAAVGYPTLRLVRIAIGKMSVQIVLPDAVKLLSKEELKLALKDI